MDSTPSDVDQVRSNEDGKICPAGIQEVSPLQVEAHSDTADDDFCTCCLRCMKMRKLRLNLSSSPLSRSLGLIDFGICLGFAFNICANYEPGNHA